MNHITQPLISIICPVYNASSFLTKCIESCINQSYKNIEIILVDDGSSDKSSDICDAYAHRDNRIIVLHKKNEGVSKARLSGFNISTGNYITFVDADDYLDENYIQTLFFQLKEKNVDLVCCNFYNCFSDGTINICKEPVSGLYAGTEKKALYDIFLYNFNPNKSRLRHVVWRKLIKRDFVKNGLEKCLEVTNGEDKICFYQWLLDIQSCLFITDPLYYYINRENSLSHSKLDTFEYLDKLIKIDSQNNSNLKKQLPYYLFNQLFSFSSHSNSLNLTEYISYIQFFVSFCNLQSITLKKLLMDTQKKRIFYFLYKSRMYKIMYFLRKILK